MSNWDSDKVAKLAKLTGWNFEVRDCAANGDVHEYYNSADATVVVTFTPAQYRGGDYISAVRHSSIHSDASYVRGSLDENATDLLGLIAEWWL